MPTINALDFELENREIEIVDILALIDCPPDDLPFLSSHSGVANLVGSGTGTYAFRADDFLGVTTVWLHAGSSALVFFFFRKRLVLVDVILMGMNGCHDATALRWAQQRLSLTVDEATRLANRRRPTLARFVRPSSAEGNADLMSLLIVVPVLCELNEVY